MKIPTDSLIVVADGRRLLMLRNDGGPAQPDLRVEKVIEHPNPANRDQVSDAPGKAFASNGSGRNAYETTDFHQLEEERFAAEAAKLVEKRVLSGEVKSVVVVAPPATLGELRKHYHKQVEANVVGELAKDLTGHPVDQIQKLLVDA
jgi:protein required for attachment to host cells